MAVAGPPADLVERFALPVPSLVICSGCRSPTATVSRPARASSWTSRCRCDLTHDELTGIASLLLVAGHETTSDMLGLGTLALLRHPEQLAILRDDDAAVPLARREMRIAVPALLRRFPDLHEEPGAVFRSFAVVHGLESLPVTW